MALSLEQFKKQYTDYDLSGLTDTDLSKLKDFQESLGGNIAFSPKPYNNPFDRTLPEHRLCYNYNKAVETERSENKKVSSKFSSVYDKAYKDPLIDSAPRGDVESLSDYTQRRSQEFTTYFLDEFMD